MRLKIVLYNQKHFDLLIHSKGNDLQILAFGDFSISIWNFQRIVVLYMTHIMSSFIEADAFELNEWISIIFKFICISLFRHIGVLEKEIEEH